METQLINTASRGQSVYKRKLRKSSGRGVIACALFGIHVCTRGTIAVRKESLETFASTIRDNEDVQFLWTMLSAEWEKGSATSLFQMVVTQWVKIRGFAYASAWLEKYKAAQKTTQKSKFRFR